MKSMLRGTLAFIATVACSATMAQPITAVLRLNEKVPLENLAYYAKAQSTPLNSYYTASDIKKISAPSDREYQGLLQQLHNLGFKVVSESATHLWITVQGDSAVFENVFATKINFAVAGGMHRNMDHIVIPQSLSLVASVTGLDNSRKSHPHYKRVPQSSRSMGGISPDDIKTAYGFQPIYANGISGAGQHVAVATYDGFKIDEVNYFYKSLKLKPGPSVDQVQFNGVAPYNEGSAGETELDAEFIGMIAPGSSVHVFASATNDDAGELQMFTAILDDNRSKVVNYSWGGCERDVAATHRQEMDKVFARAVAQGVNIMVASGDSGSDSCQDGTNLADWPAANANIVSVGGTSLSIDSDQASESAWSGSGGGISSVFNLPDWQTQLGGIYTKRSYPDVAFNANPATGQAVWSSVSGRPRWEVIGGTSMAAPQWAGFLALVNEARTSKNMNTLGFLNPLIYGMSAQDRSAAFNDITSGSNGSYSADQGWDAATGFGSMHADVLLNKLTR